MAIITEANEVRVDGIQLYRTYSDAAFKIKQIETGIIFDEAIDEDSTSYTYEETEEYTDIKQFELEAERIKALQNAS